MADIDSDDENFLNLDDFEDRLEITENDDEVLIDENFEPLLLLSSDPEIAANKRIKTIKSIFLIFTKHFSAQEQYIIFSVYNSNIKNLHLPGKVFYPIGIIIHVFKYFGITFTENLKKKLFPDFPFTLSSKRAQQLVLDVGKRFDFSIFCQKNKISHQFSELDRLHRLISSYVFYFKLTLHNQLDKVIEMVSKAGYLVDKEKFQDLAKKLNIAQAFCIDGALQELVVWFSTIVKKLIILNAYRETKGVVRSHKINNFEKETHFMMCVAFQLIVQCYQESESEARILYMQILYPKTPVVCDIITDINFYYVIRYLYSTLAVEKMKILQFISSIPNFLNEWKD